MNSRGIALVMVLVFILAVVVMANIALIIISSQTRLSHHQISRIQAYYAAQAGMNYALEMLRVNDPAWQPTGVPGTPRVRCMCRDCTVCTCPDLTTCPPDIEESDLPHTIQYVSIVVNDPDPQGIIEINATATYD